MLQQKQHKQPIIHQGYVYKQSKYFKNQNKRWMIMQGTCLYSFKDKNSGSNPTETFDLATYNDINYNKSDKQFELISLANTFAGKRLFVCDTSEEMMSWIQKIKNVQKWRCDECKSLMPFYIKGCKTCNSPRILIPLKVRKIDSNVNDNYEMDMCIRISYSSSIDIEYLLQKTNDIINTKYYPKKYSIIQINAESFFNQQLNDWSSISSHPVTKYSTDDICQQGLNVFVTNRNVHKLKTKNVTCTYIKNSDDEECPIYQSMITDAKYTQNNLNHLFLYAHFKDEYNEKPICQQGQRCKSFIRLEAGGYRLDDQCHIKLYKHRPRRNRQIDLSDNLNNFVLNTQNPQNHQIYSPQTVEQQYFTRKDGYLSCLIQEIITNGYEYDLCLICNRNDDCKHNDYSLLKIVDEKMCHIRHKQLGEPLNRAEMLSLVLYTGCDCIYELCTSQRNGDYAKWKWFDYHLYEAINKLNKLEKSEYKLYLGLNNVILNGSTQRICGYFPTYTVSSWNKNISSRFMNKGMIIEINKNMKNRLKCCDVSWISQFPDDCEILIARSYQYDTNMCLLSVLYQKYPFQTVSLSYSDIKLNLPWTCDICQYFTQFNTTNCLKCNAEKIIIPIKIMQIENNQNDIHMITLCTVYSSSINMEYLLTKANTIIQTKYHPKLFCIVQINQESFTNESSNQYDGSDNDGERQKWSNMLPKLITDYSKNDICTKGLSVCVGSNNQQKIMCQYKNSNDDDGKNNI